MTAPTPGDSPDVVEVIARALEPHEVEWIDHEVGFECGCNEHGTCEHLPTMTEVRRHQTAAITAALREARWVLVRADDLAPCEECGVKVAVVAFPDVEAAVEDAQYTDRAALQSRTVTRAPWRDA